LLARKYLFVNRLMSSIMRLFVILNLVINKRNTLFLSSPNGYTTTVAGLVTWR
jgi:hypothetical protein